MGIVLLVFSMIPIDASGQLFSFSSSTQPPTNDGLVHTETVNSFNEFNPVTHTGTFQTHPDYLLDYTNYKGQQVFIPYNIDDNSGYVNFESAHNSVTFYKDSCSVRVFNGEHIVDGSIPLISSASFDLQYAKNGTDIWIEDRANFQACNITHSITGNVITFDLIQSINGDVTKDVQFIFNLEKQTSEVIPKVTNDNSTNFDTKYGWGITLNGIKQVQVQGETVTQPITIIQNNNQNDLISIQGQTTTITLDPQNNINHYLWATKIDPNSIILDYKNAPNSLLPFQTLVIDPSWTSGSGTSQGVRSTTGTTSCATASSKSSGDSRVITPPTGDTANYCDLDTERWSITGFSQQWSATSIVFQTSIPFSSGRDKTCTITRELNDPNSATAATLQADIMSGPTYTTGQNFCEQASGSGPFRSTLGGTSASDFNTQLSLGWYAIGIRFDDQTKDHAHTDEADFSSTTLVVTYSWIPPAPITDLSCNDNAINSIACSWSIPASPTTILGYYETLNNTLHAPLYTSHLKRYYKLDYNDPTSGIIDYAGKINGTLVGGSFVNKTGIIANAMNFSGSQRIDSALTNIPIGTSDRTFTGWVKLGKTSATNQQIFGYGQCSVGSDSLDLGFGPSSQKLTAYGCINDVTGNSNLGIGDWNFFALVVSNGGTIRQIYINGTLDKQSTTGALNTVNIGSFILGANEGGGENCNCQIDDFRVYDRALKPSEILQVSNYRIINTNSYTNTVVKYPFTYNVNVQGVSYNGMVNNYLGNTVQIAPYNVIDPPYQVKATLGSDTNGFFENVTFAKPKVANSICGAYCTPNGYQIQHYNTTTHSYQTDSANQTALFKVIRNLNQNTTQNIRLFTNNHAGLSARTFPLNQTTYPQEVSHWYLQNNLVDTRNLNNGTLTGNWNFTNGRVGNAQYFDGLTYDTIPNNSVPIGTTDRTISTWVYLQSYSGNYESMLVYGSASNNALFGFWIDPTGKLFAAGYANDITGTSILPLNHWEYVSLVLSSSGTVRTMYINATLDKQSTTGALNTGSSSVYLGKDLINNNYVLTGFLSDPRLFSSALTQQQITNIYNEAIASRSNFAGSLALQVPIVGNVAANNGTITITGGFPNTNTLTTYNVKNGTTILNTTNVSTVIPNIYHIPIVWDHLSTVTNSNFKMSTLITTLSSGTQNLTSNIVTTKGTYIPSYLVNNGITYNYTVTRPTPGTNLTLKSNENPILFTMNCQIQTATNAAAGSNNGWYNQSSVGYFLQSISIHNYDNMYGSCFTPSNVKIFNFVSYGNSSLFPAITFMNQSYGAYIGVPVGVVFIVMAAALGNRRTAPMWVVIILAMAGIMSTISFFTLNSGVWALALIAGLLALFVGRKI